jgi:hypothetical protein
MTTRTREDDNPTIHGHPSRLDAATARELRTTALKRLREALFVDAEQASLFTDRQVVVIARVDYKQGLGLQTALDHADWKETARIAGVLHQLQEGLQELDLADTYA